MNSKNRCELCNSDDIKLVCTKAEMKRGGVKDINNVICLRCGFVYNSPMPSCESLQEYYNGGFTKEHTGIEQDGYNELLERVKRKKPEIKNGEVVEFFVKPYIDSNSSVLDIGCSYGIFLSEVKKRVNCKVVGIEPDSLNVRFAKEHYGLENVQNIFFEDFVKSNTEKYDFIVLRHVLEHLRDVNTVIGQLSSLTKKCGYIFITVPDIADIMPSRPLTGSFEFGHLYSFSPYTLSQILFKHGMKVVKIRRSYTNHLEILSTHIDNPVNSVPFECLQDGNSASVIIRRFKMQKYRNIIFRVKRKIKKIISLH